MCLHLQLVVDLPQRYDLRHCEVEKEDGFGLKAVASRRGILARVLLATGDDGWRRKNIDTCVGGRILLVSAIGWKNWGAGNKAQLS